MLYLLSISIGLSLTYAGCYFLYPFFFNGSIPRWSNRSARSIGIVVVLSLLSFVIASLIPDVGWSNRVLHALGGGSLGMLVCWLAVRDSGLTIRPFQLLLFSFLVVMTLGVGNEVIEFFLQEYYGFRFSVTVFDTWFDLMSNGVGAGLVALILLLLPKRSGVRLPSG